MSTRGTSRNKPAPADAAPTLEPLLRRATTPSGGSFAAIARLGRRGLSPDRAMETLIRRWRDLDAGARRRVLAAARERFGEALRRVAATPADRFARADAARLAGVTPAPEAIGVAADLTRDPDPVVAREAAGTLAHLVEHVRRLRAHQQEALARALTHLAGAGDRAAIMQLERLGPFWSPVVRGWIETIDDAPLLRMRSAIRQAADPRARARAVAWLATPGCAPGALAALSGPNNPARIARAIETAHLLHNPARRAAIDREPRTSAIPDGLGVDDATPLGVRVGRLRWLELSGHPEMGRAAADAVMDPAPEVRSRAVRILGRRPDRAEALLDFTFDAEPAISRSATLALLDREDARAIAMRETLCRSPHAATRRLVTPTPAAHWERLLAMRRRLAESPDLALAELRGRIVEGEAPDRSRAMHLARRLGALDRFETELLEAAADADARIAATGVLALGALWTAPARAAVAGALAHPDPRVRANALETIGRRDPVAAAVARAMHDDHARSRANAIRSRLREQGAEAALDHLEAMLSDDRPEHRRSALWVAERLVVRPVGRRVRRIALRDADPVVRRRAESCARRLAAGASAGGAG